MAWAQPGLGGLLTEEVEKGPENSQHPATPSATQMARTTLLPTQTTGSLSLGLALLGDSLTRAFAADQKGTGFPVHNVPVLSIRCPAPRPQPLFFGYKDTQHKIDRLTTFQCPVQWHEVHSQCYTSVRPSISRTLILENKLCPHSTSASRSPPRPCNF